MFNVRPHWDLPGLYNFKPPEGDFPGLHNFKAPGDEVPGFRINVDGSIRQTAVPTAWPDPDVGGNSFGLPDGAPAAVPASDGRPEACPLFGRVGPNCYIIRPRILECANRSSFLATALALGEEGSDFQ